MSGGGSFNTFTWFPEHYRLIRVHRLSNGRAEFFLNGGWHSATSASAACAMIDKWLTTDGSMPELSLLNAT